jgi:hypothetical protein
MKRVRAHDSFTMSFNKSEHDFWMGKSEQTVLKKSLI